MGTETENGLPRGWSLTDVENAFDVILGQSPPSSTYNVEGLGLPFFQGKAEFGDFYPIVQKWCSEPGKVAEKEDVLISVRAPVGPTNVANQKCAIGRGLAAIRPLGGTPSLFVLYLLRAFETVIAGKGTGTTFQAITGDKLRQTSIPFPPLPEQHRIVAKIEELLTRLDAGVKALNAVKAQLKRYRQSVLKSAFEGKLTAEWREIHKGRLEPASVLLERIKEERKKKLGNKYKESPPVDTTELPELPVGWAWSRVGDVGADETNAITDGPFGSNLKTSHYVDDGPRVVRLQNIGDGVFVDAEAHISEQHYQKLRKHEVFADDVVIAALGEKPPRSCLIPSSLGKAIVKADCIRLKVHPELNRRYINHCLNAPPTKERTSELLHGVGRPRLNLSEVKSIFLPIANRREQNEIVLEIERCFSVADAIEMAVEQSFVQSERLRQSILKRAFEGKLVPQDPNDPPASELLEQIRSERESGVNRVTEKTKRRTTAGK